jgi:hypothetical protein
VHDVAAGDETCDNRTSTPGMVAVWFKIGRGDMKGYIVFGRWVCAAPMTNE